MIGVIIGRTDELKPEYQVDDICFYCSVKIDKRKKILKIELDKFRIATERIFGKMPKKTRKKLAEDLKDDKPLDTSKWVKPDEETIRHELLTKLVTNHIFKENNNEQIRAQAKVEILYSILHSHSPENPQTLMNYYLYSNVETIYRELGNKKRGSYLWRKLLTGKSKVKDPMKKNIERRKKWIAAQWQEMITNKSPYKIKITKKQINYMKHALGLNTQKYPYRNKFLVYEASDLWDDLVDKDLAGLQITKNNQKTYFFYYYVTKTGQEYLGLKADCFELGCQNKFYKMLNLTKTKEVAYCRKHYNMYR